MLLHILVVLVALSLPTLLVIEEVNSWRKSHAAREQQVGLGTVTRTPEPSPATPRAIGVMRAPEHRTA